jgi:hypothetical protein
MEAPRYRRVSPASSEPQRLVITEEVGGKHGPDSLFNDLGLGQSVGLGQLVITEEGRENQTLFVTCTECKAV